MGPCVITTVKSFLRSGGIPSTLNYTYITLIPKYLALVKPQILDILTYTILSIRYYKGCWQIYFLPDLITPFQSVFVAGRMIQDNVLVDHEVFHYLQHRKGGGETECALKVDMQEVYDRVEWEFLLQSLERQGFGNNGVQWIRVFITTPTYKVLFNER